MNINEWSYIIGFIQSDGHHSATTQNRGKVTIEIHEKDKDILDKLKNILSKDYSINTSSRFRKTNFGEANFESLFICDLSFRKKILPYVPVGKKSEIIEPPLDIFTKDEMCARDYIRGLIDGDGSIGISNQNKPFISLCVSSEKIKNFILTNMEKILGIKKNINRNKRDNVYNITLYNEDAIIYAKYLYENSSIFLNRKYELYNNFSSWKRTCKKKTWKSKKWTPEEDKIALNETLSLNEKMEILSRTKKSIVIRIYRIKNNII